MSQLYQMLSKKVQEWREAGYPCADYPVITEVLEYQIIDETKTPRFLRTPQIQKETIRKSDIGNLFANKKEDEARAEIANLRLQAIASLPHLAIFSDEAHHTYGQSLDSELKKVRKTVDYLAEKTNLVCLVNTSDDSLTKQADIDAFNRLNDPRSPHRVMLLVNKGTEGWNCPSLFACALARKLRTSNNFVLQASSRCLRQVPGNAKKARIYLA